MMMTQRAVGRFLQLLAFQKLDAAHTRRRPQVIHDGERFVEAFRGDDVFVGDAFILERRCRAVAMKPDVMFSRNLSELLIKWHVDLPSLQIASPLLLFLERFKERFEITFAETLRS